MTTNQTDTPHDEDRDVAESINRLGAFLHAQGAPVEIWEDFHTLTYQTAFYKARFESAHDLITRMAIALQLFTPRLGGTIVTTVIRLARLSSLRSGAFNRENLN